MNDIVTPPEAESSERSEIIFEVLAFIGSGMWLGALLFTIARPKPGVYVTAAVLLGLVWLTLWLAQQREELARPRLAALATLLYLMATFGAISFTGSHLTQQVIAVVSAIVFFLSSRHWHRTKEPLFRGRVAAFMMTFAVAGLWYTLLSANVLVVLSWYWLLVLAAGLTMAVAVVVWREAALPWPHVRQALPAVIIFGVEVMLATWWLPTVPFVGTIIATTMLMLTLQFTRHIFKGDWTPGRGRRYMAIGMAIVIIVLATARWFA